jgi:hypothetical protein
MTVTANESPHIVKLRALSRAQHKGDFLYENADWLRDAYINRGLTLRQMATEAKCGLRTICRWMEKYDIPTDRSRIGSNPQRGENHYNWQGGPAPCPTCGGSRSTVSKACRKCRDITGSNNPKWRTDEQVTYAAMHQRVNAAKGRPTQYACAHCSAPAQEWAYDHLDPDERRTPSGRDDGPFSLDVDHYMPLCVPCHRKLDNGRRRGSRKSPPVS